MSRNGQVIFELETATPVDFFSSAYQFLERSYPKFHKMDNLCKLGWLASEILLEDRDLTNDYDPYDIGIVLSNSNSSLDTDLKYLESTKLVASPGLFVYTLPNIVVGEISIRHGFKGENSFFILEKPESHFLCEYVTDLFKAGSIKVCICGWVELLGDEYKAMLLLIENNSLEMFPEFNPGNIDSIYKYNGEING